MKYVTFDGNGAVNAVLGDPTTETTEVADDDVRYVAYITARASEDYIDQRLDSYPSLGEQMDMQYWDQKNGTTIWEDTLDAVKAAHPKPE